MRTRKTTTTKDESIILELRRFMLNADLTDRRISRLMGIEIETLKTLVAGTANPRKESLNKVHSFLKWHGGKDREEFLGVLKAPSSPGASQGLLLLGPEAPRRTPLGLPYPNETQKREKEYRYSEGYVRRFPES